MLVRTRAQGYQPFVNGVHITRPDALDELIARITNARREPVVERTAFLSEDAYRPLPMLVEAARELLTKGSLRAIHRAHAATGPLLDEISRIVHQARSRSRDI